MYAIIGAFSLLHWTRTLEYDDFGQCLVEGVAWAAWIGSWLVSLERESTLAYSLERESTLAFK